MELKIYSSANGADTGSVTVSDAIFGQEYNESLIHQVVVAYMNKGRSGTKAQKNRSAVRGGGAKPFRQKGTGRARAGTTRSPIWVGGGRAFAAQPRDYAQKVNKKMFRAAMRSILSELVRTERLKIVDAFDLEGPKTKMFVEKMKALSVDDVLVVKDGFDENAFLASRNLYHAAVCEVDSMDPVSLIGYGTVVMTSSCLEKIEGWLG